MQQSSYGIDSSKVASNVSNPYDFKNVHVSAKILWNSSSLILYFNSKNHHLHPTKTVVLWDPEPQLVPQPWEAQRNSDWEPRWNQTLQRASKASHHQIKELPLLIRSQLKRRKRRLTKKISKRWKKRCWGYSKIVPGARSRKNLLKLFKRQRKPVRKIERSDSWEITLAQWTKWT